MQQRRPLTEGSDAALGNPASVCLLSFRPHVVIRIYGPQHRVPLYDLGLPFGLLPVLDACALFMHLSLADAMAALIAPVPLHAPLPDAPAPAAGPALQA